MEATASVFSSGLSSGPQTRWWRSVEAAGCGDLVVVVDGGPGLAQAAGGAVGLVDDHEVPGGRRWSRLAATTAGREA
jgi:uncharacterized protein with ACT and thioredoxin-like domain